MSIRKPSYPANHIFIDRWSSRAMSGESLSQDQLMTLFEAARWAPSSYNNQSWRFVYACRDTVYWNNLFNLMDPFNQAWAKNASVLVVVASKRIFDFNNKPSRTHSFDAGAAWMSLALQGSMMGLVTHGMEGFNYDKAKITLAIPDDYTVEAMVAIGKPGHTQDLPVDLQKREEPSDRKQLSEIVFEGAFKNK